MLQLSDIYIYPIKSLGGIRLSHSKLTMRGLAYDRRFMLTTPEGVFLTQRKFAQMALIRMRIEGEYLNIWHQDRPQDILTIPLQPTDFQEEQEVQIWKNHCQGSVMKQSVNNWFSRQLQSECQLVYMSENSIRPVNPASAKAGEKVSFADGYPYLILGQTGMDILNKKLETPIPIDRFRANLIFTGGAAHEEDEWKYFKIGDATFRGIKPCVRCNVPNINQQTATIEKEPNRTLATYRRFDRKIYFGQNVCWEKELSGACGEVKIGDRIVLL